MAKVISNYPDDIDEMLKYVSAHPNDTAAWAELAERYERLGDRIRADYCRIYAGGPEDLAPIQKESAVRKPFPWIALLSCALVLTLLALLFLFLNSDKPIPKSPLRDSENIDVILAPIKEARQLQSEHILVNSLKTDISTHTFYFKGFDGLSHLTALTPNMLTLAATPYPLPSFLNPHACSCDAELSEIRSRTLDPWIENYESAVVMYSAIRSYMREHSGEEPTSPSELSKDYPNNIISGSSDKMQESFDIAKAAYVSSLTGLQHTSSVEMLDPGTNLNLSQQGMKPVEIIIDTKTHRLALVSGNVILRSYPVGLGGDKTPRDTFEISEKVVDPKGKIENLYGSRGMVLSDSDYAIHGTNKPESVGKDLSNGCIRMDNSDIEELFAMTPKGTKVTIQEGGLPVILVQSPTPFMVPGIAEEKNDKVYDWLD